MAGYYVPAGEVTSEGVEKRSRFLGYVWRVASEEEARARIAATKTKHYDARHNCWCYRLHEGSVDRWSDDGEPQGSAGQPMLEVFRREGVEDVCCVVTRYFGGVLLGTGGLLRAYSKAAKDALSEAGRAVVRLWAQGAVACPYALFERMKLEVAAADGVVEEVAWAADVTLYLLLPAEQWDRFAQRVTELSAGQVAAEKLGECFRAVEEG